MDFDADLLIQVLSGFLLFLLGFYLGQRKKNRPPKKESIWQPPVQNIGWMPPPQPPKVQPYQPPPPQSFQRENKVKPDLILDDLYRL
jgi:hypothetical protein